MSISEKIKHKNKNMLPELTQKNFSEICKNLPLRDFEQNLPLLFYVMSFFDVNEMVHSARYNPDMIIYYLDIRNKNKLDEIKRSILRIKVQYVRFIADWLEGFCDDEKMEMFHDDACQICSDWKSISAEFERTGKLLFEGADKL